VSIALNDDLPEVLKSVRTRPLFVMRLDVRKLLVALSHCQIRHLGNLLAHRAHAAMTTSRHVCRADALKTRCVLADVRWRWTLNVL
jgi:hypothetical protein